MGNSAVFGASQTFGSGIDCDVTAKSYLVEVEENGVAPPVKQSEVQLQFDFGDI